MQHEYSVLGGINRAAIGRYLSITASAIASAIGAGALAIIDLAKSFGFDKQVPSMVLWPLTAGVIYTVLYWWFETKFWRWKSVAKLLRVPNLSGTWQCQGQTINPDQTLGPVWTGELIVIQSWDRLRIHSRTPQSRSNSIAAALVHDEADGYRLLYNYKNEPNIDQPELTAHRGAAELLFDEQLNTARGEYFNGYGRYTFGTMTLTRGEKIGA